MPGPAPKPASQRRRRNVTAGAKKLAAVPKAKVPRLPKMTEPWHPMTEDWWTDIWSSPMATEWDDSDKHGLYMLARLVDAFWRSESNTLAKDMAGEVRLQSQRFGLSPIDRRRLAWEIDRGEEAEQKTAKRRTVAKKAKRKDPRLKAV